MTNLLPLKVKIDFTQLSSEEIELFTYSRIMVDEMFQMVTLLDTQGHVLLVNKTALDAGGTKQRELHQTPCWESAVFTADPLVPQLVHQMVNRAAQGEIAQEEIKMFADKAGTQVAVIDFSIVPVKNASGEVIYLVAEGRNITEKKMAEEQLREKNQELLKLSQRVELALESGKMGAWELDLITNQSWRNHIHDQIFGYDLSPLHWGYEILLEHVWESDRSALEQSFQNSSVTGRFNTEFRITHASDLSMRWLSIQGRAFFDEGHRPTRLMGIIMDVTERKQNEEERIELYEKLKVLDQLKGQFFANVSHELRTPLALILGPTEKLLESADLTPEQKDLLQVISRNTHFLTKQVNNLLDISKLEAGKLAPCMEEINLGHLISLIAGNFDGLAQDQHIKFSLDLDRNCFVQADSLMVQRILLNLLSNAFKFTPVQGKISIHLYQQDQYAVIEVRDTGPGVPVSMREFIFERFRQGEDSRNRRIVGTGLGLAIAKEFTDLHQGMISLQANDDGRGSIFKVSLPLKSTETLAQIDMMSVPLAFADQSPKQVLYELNQLQRRPPTLTTVQGFTEKKGTILVVEDNLDLNQFLVNLLSTHYHVIFAFDGKSGLELVKNTRPDIILSDIMMPVMDGAEMIHKIRQHAEYDSIPIIMLSAKADEDHKLHLLKNGAQDFIMKPFSYREVFVRVQAFMEIKKTRDLLQKELSSQKNSLEVLAQEVTVRRKQLQTSIESLQVAQDKAERAGQVKGQFLSIVSHETRTPLTILQLQIQLLQNQLGKSLEGKHLKILQGMSGSINSSLALMDSLIAYTDLKSRSNLAYFEKINLFHLISKCSAYFKTKAIENNLELIVVPAVDDQLEIYSDFYLLEVIVMNLLGNAVKFTDSGSVKLSVQFIQEQIVITVTDTGRGIPLNKQEAIFEPFEQLEPIEHHSRPGFGIGLSIVKETVQILGGTISLRSEVGKGSQFVVMIPIKN